MFLFVVGLFFVSTKISYAALVTVNDKGKVVWQVLGDSNLAIPKPAEITVKSVAKNIPAPSGALIALENSNGKITLNVSGDGQNQNLDVTNLNENLVEIQARGDANDIKISQENGKFILNENGISAQTAFPIIVDPVKNQLSVTTDSGDRLISVLPYEATLSLVRAKIIDKVNDNQMSLGEDSKGELIYQIDGTRNINLFNVASIKASVNSSVSASNGEILNLNQPVWLNILGFLFK